MQTLQIKTAAAIDRQLSSASYIVCQLVIWAVVLWSVCPSVRQLVVYNVQQTPRQHAALPRVCKPATCEHSSSTTNCNRARHLTHVQTLIFCQQSVYNISRINNARSLSLRSRDSRGFLNMWRRHAGVVYRPTVLCQRDCHSADDFTLFLHS